jgi:solute carrier family 13 (sodium-dependent dicarboxylate transporter), member 2/3/5
MSNTAMTAMMISSITPLIRVLGINSSFSKALLLGIPTAATIGGIGTVIGSTPNAIAVGALEEKGIHITFLDWMVFGFPTALILLYSFYLLLVYKLRIKEIVLDIPIFKKSEKKVETSKRILVISILSITIIHGRLNPCMEFR